MRQNICISVSAADRARLEVHGEPQHASVDQLETAIHDYLDHNNAAPKPFIWSKNAPDILVREARAKDTLDVVKSGYQALDSEH